MSTSSSSREFDERLASVAVTADSIGVRPKQPPPGQENGRAADESMPAAFQDKIWEALQRKLDRELHADKAARHSPAQAEAPAAGVMTVQMFSSNAQQRRCKAVETAAALSPQQQGQSVPSKLKRRQLTFGNHAQVLQQATAVAVTSEAVRTAAARACHSAAGCVAEAEELDEQEEGEVVRTGGKQAIYEALSDPSAIHSKRIGDSRAAKKRLKQLAEQAQAAPTEPPAGNTATVAMQSSAASGSSSVPAAGKKKRKGKAERKRDKQRAEAAQAALRGAENGGLIILPLQPYHGT